MNRRFLISAAAMSFLSLMAGFVVHATLLKPLYATLPALYRNDTDSAAYFPWMLLAHVLIGTGLTWIYRSGRGSGAWAGQGLRFGCAVAVLTTVPTCLIYYAVQPLPGMLVARQIGLDVVAILLLGLAVAWLNRAGD